jgi:hypothetical protein
MEVNVQSHAPVDLPPGKVPPGIHLTGGWVGSRADLKCFWKRQKCVPLADIRTPDWPAVGPVSARSRCSCSCTPQVVQRSADPQVIVSRVQIDTCRHLIAHNSLATPFVLKLLPVVPLYISCDNSTVFAMCPTLICSESHTHTHTQKE